MIQHAYPNGQAVAPRMNMNGSSKDDASKCGAVDQSAQITPLYSCTAPDLNSLLAQAKWGWACRSLDCSSTYMLDESSTPPCPGDVVLVRVESIGNHTRVMTGENERLRLYPGDVLVGVMGNRYATDAYEAEVIGTDDLHLLTNACMIGTVLNKNLSMKRPSRVSFLGYLANEMGMRLNLKSLLFAPKVLQQPFGPIILAVGSGMNSGKTTAVVKLVKSLTEQGLRVAACKLTGSVSTNDYGEYAATAAHHVTDFSDYGFPSTYLCSAPELFDLYNTMMTDAAATQPAVTVVEIADGILQRETKMLLDSPYIRNTVSGVVLAANCASSALYGLDQLQRTGHNVLGVSGLITSSPLFTREYINHCDTPIISSAGTGEELAQHVVEKLNVEQLSLAAATSDLAGASLR